MVGYYGASDVPGSNAIGPVQLDEEVFAKDKVTAVGQVRRGVRGGRQGVMNVCCG